VKPKASTKGALSFGSVFFMRIKKMNARHGSGFLNKTSTLVETTLNKLKQKSQSQRLTLRQAQGERNKQRLPRLTASQ
jgi:hypothetical protein